MTTNKATQQQSAGVAKIPFEVDEPEAFEDQDFIDSESEMELDDAEAADETTTKPGRSRFASSVSSSSGSHQDHADTIVQPKLVSSKPGRIKTKGSFTLHTQLAHRLFYGRKKSVETTIVDGKPVKRKLEAVIGLVRFTSNINQLYNLAEMDDPYADYMLLKIETSMAELKANLSTNIEALRQLLGDVEDMQIDASFSVKPIQLPLEFQTPFYGFEAARIVKYYDRLVLLALTTRHTGDLLDSDWNRVVNHSARDIRRVFLMSTQYKFAGVTRDDMAANNQRARAAIEQHGELPQNVVEGRKRAIHAPKIKR